MSAFADIEAIGPLRVWDDVVAREVHGEQSTLAVVELGPGAIVPEHRHANEQRGLVIQGELAFRIGSGRELGPGATCRILGDVPHSVRSGPGRGRDRRLRPGPQRLGEAEPPEPVMPAWP